MSFKYKLHSEMGGCFPQQEAVKPQISPVEKYPDVAKYLHEQEIRLGDDGKHLADQKANGGPPAVSLVFTKDLNRLTYANTKEFIPTFTKAKVVKVYDGDTVTLAAEYHGECYRFAARMFKYNSAELRSKDPAEKKKAQESKAALAQLVDGKILRVEVVQKREKWGRLLVLLYVVDGQGKEMEVNQWMLDHHHGVPYAGGTKTWQ